MCSFDQVITAFACFCCLLPFLCVFPFMEGNLLNGLPLLGMYATELTGTRVFPVFGSCDPAATHWPVHHIHWKPQHDEVVDEMLHEVSSWKNEHFVTIWKTVLFHSLSLIGRVDWKEKKTHEINPVTPLDAGSLPPLMSGAWLVGTF